MTDQAKVTTDGRDLDAELAANQARLEKPCKRCSECEGTHHFSEAMTSFASEEPTHTAALSGVEIWYTCKHCEAWRADDDLELAEEDES